MEIAPIHGPLRNHVFVGMDLTPYLHPAPSNPLRSSATFARVYRDRPSHTEEAPRAVRSTLHTVERGDTLSELVHRHLRDAGEPARGAALYDRVREVARWNGIADPDVIVPGQQIDLGALDGQGGPARTQVPRSADILPMEPAPALRSSALITRSIRDVVPGETRITSDFGLRHDPFEGDIRDHRGIDIAARRGSPIYPIDDGTVVFSGWHGGHGKTVIVRHDDGTETVYAHADALLVDAGQQVKVGDKLGLVGSTGRSTGPHLHFEVRRGGVPIDPLAALPELDSGEGP